MDPLQLCRQLQKCLYRYTNQLDGQEKIIDWLNVMLKSLDRCDSGYELRKALGDLNMLVEDLLPLAKNSYGHTELFALTLRMLVHLTGPLTNGDCDPMLRRDLLNQMSQYKKIFANIPVWKTFQMTMADCLSDDLNKEQIAKMTIKNILNLICNVLRMKPRNDSPKDLAPFHDQVVWSLDMSRMTKYVINIAVQDKKAIFYKDLHEIPYLLLCGRSPRDLTLWLESSNIDATCKIAVNKRLGELNDDYEYPWSGCRERILRDRGPNTSTSSDLVGDRDQLVIHTTDSAEQEEISKAKSKYEYKFSSSTLRLSLRDFCNQVLDTRCYEIVIKNGKHLLLMKYLDMSDQVLVLWNMFFFLQFNEYRKGKLSNVMELMNASTFNLISDFLETHWLGTVGDNEIPVLQYRLALYSVRAYTELLSTLMIMAKQESDEAVAETAFTIKSHLFFDKTRREMIPTLAMTYMTECGIEYHECLLQAFRILLLHFKDVIENTKPPQPQRQKITLVDGCFQVSGEASKALKHWWSTILEERLRDVYRLGVPVYCGQNVTAYDDERMQAVIRVQYYLKANEPGCALALHRAMRLKWPVADMFGQPDMKEKDEIAVLKHIYLSSLNVIDGVKDERTNEEGANEEAVNVGDDDDEEEGDDDSKNDPNRPPKRDWSFRRVNMARYFLNRGIYESMTPLQLPLTPDMLDSFNSTACANHVPSLFYHMMLCVLVLHQYDFDNMSIEDQDKSDQSTKNMVVINTLIRQCLGLDWFQQQLTRNNLGDLVVVNRPESPVAQSRSESDDLARSSHSPPVDMGQCESPIIEDQTTGLPFTLNMNDSEPSEYGDDSFSDREASSDDESSGVGDESEDPFSDLEGDILGPFAVRRPPPQPNPTVNLSSETGVQPSAGVDVQPTFGGSEEEQPLTCAEKKFKTLVSLLEDAPENIQPSSVDSTVSSVPEPCRLPNFIPGPLSQTIGEYQRPIAGYGPPARGSSNVQLSAVADAVADMRLSAGVNGQPTVGGTIEEQWDRRLNHTPSLPGEMTENIRSSLYNSTLSGPPEPPRGPYFGSRPMFYPGRTYLTRFAGYGLPPHAAFSRVGFRPTFDGPRPFVTYVPIPSARWSSASADMGSADMNRQAASDGRSEYAFPLPRAATESVRTSSWDRETSGVPNRATHLPQPEGPYLRQFAGYHPVQLARFSMQRPADAHMRGGEEQPFTGAGRLNNAFPFPRAATENVRMSVVGSADMEQEPRTRVPYSIPNLSPISSAEPSPVSSPESSPIPSPVPE